MKVRTSAVVVAALFGTAAGVALPRVQSGSAEAPAPFTLASASAKVLAKYPGSSPALPRHPEGVAVRMDVAYAIRGSDTLRLDLFYSANASGRPSPAVVILHGGGWNSGDRSMEIPVAEELAHHGYVAATCDYRLAGAALFPGGVLDVKSALRWLRLHASVANIDTERIGIWGASAGGEVAAFVGATNGDARYEDSADDARASTCVAAVVDVDGLLDFTDTSSTKYDADPAKPSAAHRWLGGSFREIPAVWKEASPITHVSTSTPPMLFINSSLEHYHAGRDAMIGRLSRLGIASGVRTIPDTPHPFWLFHPWFDKTLAYTIEFFDKELKRR